MNGELREPGRKERGQTLIEFAFVAPVILVLLMTIVDFAIAVDRREVIQHAVREGARQAAVGQSTANVTDIVVNESQGVIDPADVDVCYVDGPGGSPSAGAAGSNVRVSATYTYEFTLGAGELLAAFGVDPNGLDIEMTPHGEARMEANLAGVTECP